MGLYKPAGGGGGGTALSDATPLSDLITAAAGTGVEAARADHRHPLGGIFHQRYRTGQYYSTFAAGLTATTISSGVISFAPFLVSQQRTFDQVAIEITAAAAAAGVWRLGLYGDDGTGYPGALLGNYGTVDVSTVGTKAIVISHALAPGFYWLCVLAEITAGSRFNSGDAIGMFNTFNNSGAAGYLANHATGVLPNPAPAALPADTITMRSFLRAA